MTTGFDRRTEHGSDDPGAIRSIAVTVDDVVTALEARQRGDTEAVLRVTPPFAGRMRARLHVVSGEGASDGGAEPIHFRPERFVDPDVSSVPTVDETADELRARGEYSVDDHRAFHADVVESWRETVREALVEQVTVETAAASHAVTVKYLDGQRE
ncbi:hypothetical protein [Salinigranum marinum]|uniref:hypothetical protein n=1 Tax=Salinigranum marinum TaxID=1515595 RepID=UPI002989FE99|nr:hypothetical protein [Salinigranum marinum]